MAWQGQIVAVSLALETRMRRAFFSRLTGRSVGRVEGVNPSGTVRLHACEVLSDLDVEGNGPKMIG